MAAPRKSEGSYRQLSRHACRIQGEENEEALLWIIAIIFIIGLLVVTGVLKLIF